MGQAANSQLIRIVFKEIIREDDRTFAEITRTIKKKYGYSRS